MKNENTIEVSKDEKPEIKKAEMLIVRSDDVVVWKNNAAVIVSDEQYAEAGTFLRDVRTQVKKLTEMRLEKTRPLDKLKADWMTWFANPIDKLKRADEAITSAMRRFDADKEAKRVAEENRLREIQEAEIKKAEKAAAKAEAKGDVEKANELKDKAQIVAAAPIVVAAAPVEVAGVARTRRWKARIIESDKVPRQFCEPVQSLLDKHAREYNDRVPVEGVEFYFVDDFAARSTQAFQPEF